MIRLKTTRIGSDGYVRPKQTITDKLTKDDIKEKLEDYLPVDDLTKVPLGVHMRYFTLKDGKRLFRLGGQLIKNDGLPAYILLSNGTKSWSVQVKDTIFYRKMTEKEIKESYQKIINDKDKTIKDQDKKIRELVAMIKDLKKQLGQ
jgi:hypothetical protein